MSNVKTQNYSLNPKSDVKLRAYHFSLSLIKFIATFPNTRTYWVIGDQLLRSGTSVGANVVEAKSSSSKKDFIHYYEISLKSANETKYWLYLLKDSKLVSEEQINFLINEVTEISNMLGSSVLTMKGKK